MPVYNGLTDECHPTQILADFLTMREHVDKPLSQTSFAFLGDAGNNMGNSLLIGAAKMGMDIRLCASAELMPATDIQLEAKQLAEHTGARLMLTQNIDQAVAGVDFIYTDVWVSMGEPKEVWSSRIEQLKPFQVNSDIMASSGNPHTRFMHCLPAFHDACTTVGAEIHDQFSLDAMEATDEVFESPASIVFDQAENRLLTIKAVLVATLGH